MQNRPLFHGAYEVLNAPNSTSQFGNLQEIRRIFIHRQGFFIIQFQDDKMKDFQMKTNTLTNTIDVYALNKKMTLKITATEIFWHEKNNPGTILLSIVLNSTSLKRIPPAVTNSSLKVVLPLTS